MIDKRYESHALKDIAAERLRQIELEGWTPEHDDEHIDGEMAQAAAVYAAPFEIQLVEARSELERGKDAWPWRDRVDVSAGRGDCPVWGWARTWFKPKGRREDLVRAGALIVAEIERFDRIANLERCIACDQKIEDGDLVYNDVNGGLIHAGCCGPERESYCGPDGAPLANGEPIPEPYAWRPEPETHEEK